MTSCYALLNIGADAYTHANTITYLPACLPACLPTYHTYHIYIYGRYGICIWNEELKSETSGKIYVKTKYEIFLQWNTNFFLQKVQKVLLHFVYCQNSMSSAILAAEIHWKIWNKRVLSTGEPCTCEYVTLLQSFHRGTLSIHWYIAQNF